jgi:hypothetical protein
MKKIIAVCAAILCIAGFSFAEESKETKESFDLLKEPTDSMTRTIVPKDIHTTNKTAKVTMEYTPLTDEARIQYTCLAVSFDQGDAMNSILGILQDFEKENQYYSYKYLKRDSVRYIQDEHNLKMAVYESYVKMSR